MWEKGEHNRAFHVLLLNKSGRKVDNYILTHTFKHLEKRGEGGREGERRGEIMLQLKVILLKLHVQSVRDFYAPLANKLKSLSQNKRSFLVTKQGKPVNCFPLFIPDYSHYSEYCTLDDTLTLSPLLPSLANKLQIELFVDSLQYNRAHLSSVYVQHTW